MERPVLANETKAATTEKRDRLLEKKNKILAQLRALDARETTQRRKAETRAKIILGGLLLAHKREILPELLAKATDRDRELLKAFNL